MCEEFNSLMIGDTSAKNQMGNIRYKPEIYKPEIY